MKFFYYALFLCFVGVGCQDAPPAKSEKNEVLDEYGKYIVGKWETKKFLLEMPTNQGTEDDKIMKIDFDNPRDPMAKMKSLSTYKEDGTFESWYIDTLGNEFGRTNGTWNNKGQELSVRYEYQNTIVTPTYEMNKTPYGMEFYSIYDWDKDGVQDDTLYMESLKF